MLTFSRPNELRIPQGQLLQASEHFEFVPPAEHAAKLQFQVFCNGVPIGSARLEKLERLPQGDGRVLNLFDARHRATYALKMIQVSQNYRNRGIGTVLLKEILHYCRNHNIHRITGEIKGETARLREWYRRNGFTVANDTSIEFLQP
jgi:GNAT superfamily N-acetyltransferase